MMLIILWKDYRLKLPSQVFLFMAHTKTIVGINASGHHEWNRYPSRLLVIYSLYRIIKMNTASGLTQMELFWELRELKINYCLP